MDTSSRAVSRPLKKSTQVGRPCMSAYFGNLNTPKDSPVYLHNCQDNTLGWVNWSDRDDHLLEFVRRLSKLRRENKVLRQTRFLHSRPRIKDGKPDVFWRLPGGDAPTRKDWEDPALKTVSVELRTSSTTPYYAASDDVIFLVFNNGNDIDVVLPPCAPHKAWERVLDTAAPDEGAQCVVGTTASITAASVCVFTLIPNT